MTTANSAPERLKAQADAIAKAMKRGVRGELPNFPKRDQITFGIAMDDGIRKVTIAWKAIEDSDEAALSAMIVREMQKKKADA